MYEQKYILKCICVASQYQIAHIVVCVIRSTERFVCFWRVCVCCCCFFISECIFCYSVWPYIIICMSPARLFWFLFDIFLLSAFACEAKTITEEGRVIEFNNVDYFVILFGFWLTAFFPSVYFLHITDAGFLVVFCSLLAPRMTFLNQNYSNAWQCYQFGFYTDRIGLCDLQQILHKWINNTNELLVDYLKFYETIDVCLNLNSIAKIIKI